MNDLLNFNRQIPVESVISKLNPLIKIGCLLTILINTTNNSNIASLLVSNLCLIIIVVLSKMPISYFLKQIKYIFIFISFFFLIAFISNQPSAYYIIVFLKFFATFGLLITFMATTNMLVFINDFNAILSKFIDEEKSVKFSFFLFSIINIIPILLHQLNIIYQTMKLKGVNFNHRNLITRFKNYSLLLIPFMRNIDSIAEQMSLAYNSRELTQTKLFSLQKKISVKVADILLIIITIGIVNIMSYLK